MLFWKRSKRGVGHFRSKKLHCRFCWFHNGIFWLKILNKLSKKGGRVLLFRKKGPNQPGRGQPPPPLNGKCPFKNVFFHLDAFPKSSIEDFFGRTECYQNSPPHMLKTLHSMYIYQNAIVVFLETMIAE